MWKDIPRRGRSRGWLQTVNDVQGANSGNKFSIINTTLIKMEFNSILRLSRCVLVFLFVFNTSSSVYSQVEITQVYKSGSIDLFSSNKYENAITRQHSITIDLREFVLTEIKDGDYILSLKIRFLNYLPNSSVPQVKKEVNTVFYDDELIRSYENIEENGTNRREKKQSIQLSLSDKLLVFSHSLIDISHIEITVRMTRIKDEYQDFLETMSPIFNVATSTNATVQLVDNLLDGIESDEVIEPLLFRGEIYIPANIFDYQNNIEKNTGRVVESNEEFAIVLNGMTPINDNSLKGKAKTLVNRISKFISGSEQLNKESIRLGGLISLVIIKNDKPVIPKSILEKLTLLEEYLLLIDPSKVENEFNTNVKEVSKMIEFAVNVESITPSIEEDISQYVKLAQFCYLFLDEDSKGDKISKNIVRSYKRWYDSINLRGAANDMHAIAIQGIYNNDEIAKIFIPSGLSDFQIMSFFLWQKGIHEILAGHNISELAEEKK